jgi:hypothetical protein
VNELRLGFNRMGAEVLQQNHGVDINALLGFPDVLTNPVDLGAPNINMISFDRIGAPINYPQNRDDTTIQISDNVAWTVGRSQIKIGTDLRDVRIDNYLDFLARGDWFFLGDTVAGILAYPPISDPIACTPSAAPPFDPITCSLAQLLGGIPDYAIAVSGFTQNDLRSHGISAYAQDDIHVIPRFLLNVGVRYEYNSPPIEAHNRFSVPDLVPSATPEFTLAGTNGIPQATYNPTYRDVEPRIGFAWRPMKSERWVVRSAYGIFYDVAIGNINIFPRINPPFYTMAAYYQTPSCPGMLCTVQDLLNQTGQQSGVVQGNMISPNFRDGYMQQWNADLQYEVGHNWMVDVAYVGSKGTHLANVIDQNQTNPFTGPPYPQFSSVLYVESNANSTYHSLQIRSEKRVSHGLDFLAAYTFSKSIDDISSVFGGSVGSGLPQDSLNIRGDRGLSDFNAAQRLSVSFLYDLPFRSMCAHGPGWSGKLVDDWQAGGILTAVTGSPFTVVLPGLPTASAAAFGNPARPDLVGDPSKAGPVAANPTCQAPDQLKTPQNWFNQCAFAQPANGTYIPPGSTVPVPEFGNEGRNILTGPDFIDFDFSLTKSLPLVAEKHRLLLSGEFFNLLNHPNFDMPVHEFDFAACGPSECPAENFGSILSANSYGNKPPRQIQVSLKYIF